MSELRNLAARLLHVLAEAQKERPQRDSLTERADGTPELEWVAYERNVMKAEVNRIRAEAGREPVSLAQIERVEGQAVGHFDYSSKFALYCAELALSA